jgi:hypothetical protein
MTYHDYRGKQNLGRVTNQDLAGNGKLVSEANQNYKRRNEI